jgi:hypothetical protein
VWVVLAAGLVFLGADSPPDATFVFDNRTGAPVLLSYTLKAKQEWPAVTTPAVAQSPSGEGAWRELQPGEFLASSDGRTKTVEVKPGESLRVAIVERYPGHGMRGLWMFPVNSLQLADAHSKTAASLSLESCEALLSFERWSDSLYVLQAKRAVPVPGK